MTWRDVGQRWPWAAVKRQEGILCGQEMHEGAVPAPAGVAVAGAVIEGDIVPQPGAAEALDTVVQRVVGFVGRAGLDVRDGTVQGAGEGVTIKWGVGVRVGQGIGQQAQHGLRLW